MKWLLNSKTEFEILIEWKKTAGFKFVSFDEK